MKANRRPFVLSCLRQRPNWANLEHNYTLSTWETEAETSLGGLRFRTASETLCQKAGVGGNGLEKKRWSVVKWAD